MNHGLAEGAAGKKRRLLPAPLLHGLWRTVLEETNLTLPVERAEKTIHPCASFPYEGVIESDGTQRGS